MESVLLRHGFPFIYKYPFINKLPFADRRMKQGSSPLWMILSHVMVTWAFAFSAMVLGGFGMVLHSQKWTRATGRCRPYSNVNHFLWGSMVLPPGHTHICYLIS